MLNILQRSHGELDIYIKNNDPKKLYQNGSLKIFIPNNYNNIKELVLANTAGGVTCNDSNCIKINLENSTTSICTQAAEKIYAGIGNNATINVDIFIKNSNLFWLPKELILFNNAKLNRKININMDKQSNVIFCETSIFGRRAMSEKIKNLSFSDIWKFYIDNKISHLESINIDGETDKLLKNKFTLDKQSAISTILIFGDIVTKIENDLRKVLKNITDINCEISTWDKKLVIRAIADDNYQLKNKIKYILENIIYDKIPKTWYL